MEDAKTAQARAELLELAHQPAETPEERYRVLDALDRFLRQTTERTTDIRKARSIIGTCPDMCPEKERYLRDWKIMVPSYERQPGSNHIDHAKAIKQYSRSSADQVLPLPHELRTEQALGGTMYFLWSQHADRINADQGGGANVSDWYHYIWDRTRSIRKDITQQELCSPTVVELVQQCARFHIHCAARCVTEDPSVFDQKINTENLTKCLQTLKYLYSDLRQQQIQCPDEPEFRSYMMLLYLNEGNFQSELRELSATILHSEPVQFALSVHLTLVQNNYARFFEMVRGTTYMNACILLRYFTQVRQTALDVIRKSYASRSTANFPLSYLATLLGFDRPADALDFFSHYGVTVYRAGDQPVVQFEARQQALTPDVPHAAGRSQIVEQKLTGTVGEAICGKSLEAWGAQFPPAPCVSSFDQFGRLRPELLQKVLHPGTLGDPEGAPSWAPSIPSDENDTTVSVRQVLHPGTLGDSEGAPSWAPSIPPDENGTEGVRKVLQPETLDLDDAMSWAPVSQPDDDNATNVRKVLEPDTLDREETMSWAPVMLPDDDTNRRAYEVDLADTLSADSIFNEDVAFKLFVETGIRGQRVGLANRSPSPPNSIAGPGDGVPPVEPRDAVKQTAAVATGLSNIFDDAPSPPRNSVVSAGRERSQTLSVVGSLASTTSDDESSRRVVPPSGPPLTPTERDRLFEFTLYDASTAVPGTGECTMNVDPLGIDSDEDLFELAAETDVDMVSILPYVEAGMGHGQDTAVGHIVASAPEAFHQSNGVDRALSSVESDTEAEGEAHPSLSHGSDDGAGEAEEEASEAGTNRSEEAEAQEEEEEEADDRRDMRAVIHRRRWLQRKYFAIWLRAARLASSWRRMMNMVPSVQPHSALLPSFDRLEASFRGRDTGTKSFADALNEPAVRINLLPFEVFRKADLLLPFEALRLAAQTAFAWDLAKLREMVKPIYWRLVISIPSEHDDPNRGSQLVGFPSFVERWLRECTVRRFRLLAVPDHSKFFLEACEPPLFECWAPHTAICMRLVRGTRALDETGAVDARVCSRYNGLLLFLNDMTPMSVERDRLRALLSSDGPPPAAIAVMYYSRSKKLPLEAVQAQLLEGVDLRDGAIAVRTFYWTDIATNRTLREALAYLAESHCQQLNRQQPATMLRMRLLGDLLDDCLGAMLWFRWNQATGAMNERLPNEYRCLRLAAITLDANALVDLYNACLKRVLEQIGNPYVRECARVHSDFDGVRQRWRASMDPALFRQPLGEGYFAPHWDIFPADLLCELEQSLTLHHLPDELLAATGRVYGMLAYNKAYGNVPRALDLDELRSCLRHYLRSYSHLLEPDTLATLESNMLTSLVNQLAGGSVVDEALLVVGRGRTTRNVYWPTVLRFLAETLLRTLLGADQRMWREVYYIHGWFASFTSDPSFWKDTDVFINYKPKTVPGFPSP
ncbi:AGAP007989-PA-like protein [Anopheles sinensis]|uniref:AGAP007989-PA-like protein n=1 Tax=Anopheles sinensis TaxID=74873 RepID=A0A084WFR5_ANOSI|nr:AGAP007989-PA-like protein [Anopheles sinensis]